MNKRKAVFVTILVSAMMALIAATTYKTAHTAFVAIESAFACIGFIFSSAAFCKWLEKPAEKPEETIAPPAIIQRIPEYDFSEIIDEVRRNA